MRPAAAPPGGCSEDRGESELRALGDAPSDRTPAGTTKWRIFRKGDDKCHLPLGDEEFVLDYVDEADDQAAEEIAAYVPTRDELARAVSYWRRQILDIEWFIFITGQVGCWEMRHRCYAGNFIAKAAQAIGDEAIREAIREADDMFRAKVNDALLWEIFTNGTQERWEAFQGEQYRRQLDYYAALERLEQLARESRGSFVAAVLCKSPDGKGKPILVSPVGSELSAALLASGEFGVETGTSALALLMLRPGHTHTGFLRATRQNGDWLLDFPCSKQGTTGRLFLERIVGRIRDVVLRAKAGRAQ
jgi:hypothetical protein